jgi:hypothetical protein
VLTAVLIAVAVRARLAAGGFGDVFPQQATSSASAAPVWCWLGFVAVVLTMVAQAVRATMRRPVVWTVGQWNRQACP